MIAADHTVSPIHYYEIRLGDVAAHADGFEVHERLIAVIPVAGPSICFEETIVGRAIGLGFVVVVTYSIVRWTSPGLYWVEFALMVAVVVGIGAVVAHAGGQRPFLTAAVASFMTVLCIEYLALFAGPAWARPEVLPPPVTTILVMVPFSLMIAAMTGAVALGLRSLRGRLRIGR